MKLRDIVETLNDIVEDLAEDENPEVRFAAQPSYPLEHSISDLVSVEIEGKDYIYFAEGGQTGYLNGAAREALGW